MPGQRLEQHVLFSAPITEESANNFICLLSTLATQGISRAFVGMNCSGGHIPSGIAMHNHNCMKAMPLEIVTHNIGNVDSIANIVFLGGDERYACGASTFMFHGAGVNSTPTACLQEKDLLERLDVVEAEHKRMSELIAGRTKLSAAECKELFKEQRMRDALWAKNKGFVDEVRDFAIPADRNVVLLVAGQQDRPATNRAEGYHAG